MEVGPGLRTARGSGEAPTVQLSRETGKLGRLEVLGQNIRGKGLFLVNGKARSVGEPRDDALVVGVGEDIQELNKKGK